MAPFRRLSLIHSCKIIGDHAGEMLTRYFKRDTYVDVALSQWTYHSVPIILEKIKSGLGEDGYSKVEPEFTKTRERSQNEFKEGSIGVFGNTSNILKGIGSNIDNLEKIQASTDRVLRSHWMLVLELKLLLGKFEGGKTFEGYLANVIQSIDYFRTEQRKLHIDIMKEFRAAHSQ
ncbi:hypothetical protein BASA61_008499 [Batrachochytrium salamandrivorans]|nr:hypothetical protein BASA61_008499 [Batrachochytrium salamandrivorans]